MKRLNKLIVFGLIFTTFWSCKKMEDMIVINPNAVLTATLSAPTLTLLKDNELKDALTVSWVSPEYGFQAAPAYSVYMVKKGGDITKATPVGVGANLKLLFKTSELNAKVIGLGIAEGTTGDVDVVVESLVGAYTKLRSSVLSLKVTTYVDKLNLTSPWGLVGDATANGWNGPDQPMYRSPGVANELVCYVSVTDGQVKFRRYNDWLINLGSSGTVEPDPAQTGTLAANGKNIGVKKGMYKFAIDTIALKYTITPVSWGLVGDATTGGWNGPDMPMRYDPTIDMWRAEVKLTAGAVKFRLNNDWGTNYGATGTVEPAPIGTGGDLAAGGKNFGVTAGTYLVTLDLKKLKYTFTPYKPWGLVGDATPTGWNGPDTKFTYDLSTKKWVLNNIVLTAAAIKFRENDDWGNNFGATGTVEPLPLVSGATSTGIANGKNLGVAAGTWSFELDLADPANPKYKGTKK